MLALAKSSRRKTSLIFSVEERTGSLAGALAILASRNINGDKLESKPHLGHGTERVFYVDFDGDLDDANVADALAELKKALQDADRARELRRACRRADRAQRRSA